MNIQQLEYIVAVDACRNFVQAAEKCFVTQPTLSTMIQKLEEELEIRIFDRKKHPVAVTEAGEMIIRQAKIILNDIKQLKSVVNEYKGEIKGEIRLGIIPTVAPYLLPLFLNEISTNYPQLSLKIEEQTTEKIIENIRTGSLDLGILATPLKENSIAEYPVYYERFLVYTNPGHRKDLRDKNITPMDLKDKEILLLEEGHCFRNQLIKICELKEKTSSNIRFEAGSIETLMHLVDEGYGLTLLPELALKYMNEDKRKNTLNFIDPQPVREISIVSHVYFERKKIIDVLRQAILKVVLPLIENRNNNLIEI